MALLGFFPVCTTFAALGVIALIIIVCFGTSDDEEAVVSAEESGPVKQYASWWVYALIPVVIGIVLGLLAWATEGN